MKSSIQTKELLSALADGQLGGEDFATALKTCVEEQSAQSALTSWNTYHLIGEVMRSPAPVVHATDMAFVSRLNQRLAQEPLVRVMPRSLGLESGVSDLNHHRSTASNQGMFRWKLVAGLASLAAVSAIAWNASGLQTPESPAQLAQQSSEPRQVLMPSPQGPVVRDARLEELLAAHKQLAGTSVLQEPSGFLRRATFEASQTVRR